MDQLTKELRYMKKIENDINERLYDLLVVHLVNHHEKVRKSGHNKDDFIALLEKAIANLRKGITTYNKIHFYRYILICCNAILVYDTKRQDIKDLKKELVEDYTASEHDSDDKIPLNYQINEVRLTYDASYLCYLIKRMIDLKEWDKALYCWHTVNLIEPDKEELDDYYKTIKSHIADSEIKEVDFGTPKDKILVLDSNVVISRIFYNVGDYKLGSKCRFDLEKLGNNNSFIITPSTIEEVKKHLDFQLISIRRFCRNQERFNYEEIESTLKKRFEKVIDKYSLKKDVKVEKEVISKIKEFYHKHLNKLEEIMLEKIRSKYVSHKLRKLAQRDSLMPEEGDMTLLAEVIELNKTSDKEVGILTEDKDFVEFVGGIEEEFGVRVYV
ncbi:MAG: hypothetical protein KKF65_01760 [Nanoarchaeota archaeon]|nr:hypothetical protein [Nanoarchaeota archaeon]